jgi:hypothetical protein
MPLLFPGLLNTGTVMQNLTKLRSITLVVCASFALAAGTPALAQHGGGHVAVGHGFGGHGGCCGWRGGFWGPWGWGWGGVGLGLYFATLPYYYSTYWWGGVPYYYADNTYYRWDPAVGQYQTVAPPSDLLNRSPGAQTAAPSELFVYPKNGQSQEQLGKDKFECHRWAVGQTGFDPTQPRGGAAPGNRSNYLRAQAACLEGRGYSVK